MRLEINDNDLDHGGSPPKLHMLRAAAYFLLHAAGDVDENGETTAVVPTGTIVSPPKPPLAPAAMAPAANTAVASAAASTIPSSAVPAPPTVVQTTAVASNVPPPPPPPPTNIVPPPPPVPTNTADDNGDDEGDGPAPSNVVQGNFPQAGPVPPPPPTSNGTGANTAVPPSPPTTPNAVTAEGAVIVVSAEVDSAGMPYDARIHQKAKGKMKNGQWKLIKGIDEAIVSAVTKELAVRKLGANPAGSLPPSGNTVPVPPSPPNTPAPPVPPSNGVGGTVPVPPAPPVGPLGNGDAYRNFVDKVIALNKEGKVTSEKVNSLCQLHGATSIMALASMPHLIADVERAVDASALGLM